MMRLITTSVDTTGASLVANNSQGKTEGIPATAHTKEPFLNADIAPGVQGMVIGVGFGVIPVGQEPSRESLPDVTAATRTRALGSRATGKGREPIRDPDGFYRYRNRLEEIRVFVMETQRNLKRSQIAVWLAIHNCQKRGAALIGQERISELSGTSKKHVGLAIKALVAKGLLQVLFKGKFVRNGMEGSGLASRYRVYPKPEPRLLAKPASRTAAPEPVERGGPKPDGQ